VNGGPGADSVVATYPGLSCESNEYKNTAGFMWFLVVTVVIGVPVGIAVGLWWNRKRLYDPEDDKFKRRYGIVFETYLERRFWWEVVILIRRVVLIAVYTGVNSNFALQNSWLSVANVLFLLIHLVALPYASPADNIYEATELVVLIILTTLLSSAPIPLTLPYQVGLSLLVLGTATVFLIRVVYNRVTRWYQRRRDKAKKGSVPGGGDEPPSGPVLELTRKKDGDVLPAMRSTSSSPEPTSPIPPPLSPAAKHHLLSPEKDGNRSITPNNSSPEPSPRPRLSSTTTSVAVASPESATSTSTDASLSANVAKIAVAVAALPLAPEVLSSVVLDGAHNHSAV